MAGRVTRDPETDVPTINLSLEADAPPLAEQLSDPEVAAALAGGAPTSSEHASELVDPTSDDHVAPEATEMTEDADAASDQHVTEPRPPELETVRLNRHQSPSKATTSWIATELERSRITIEGVIVDDEGRHWQGVSVLPWPTVLAILATVPEQHPLHAELVAGGDLYTRTPCPDCGEMIRHKVDTYGDMRIQGKKGIREVKPTFDAKWKAHVCGQAELPLHEEATGQTKAFPETPEPAPERTTPIPVVPVEDVIKLLDRMEREGLLPDGPLALIPPDEEIATWSTDDLGLAYEYAWSVVHQEPERPPVPRILQRDQTPVETAVEAMVDGQPIGCSHEGRGLPGCPVCDPEGAADETPLGEATDGGTGDPDGDLLP